MLDQPFSISKTGDDVTSATMTVEPLRQGFGTTIGVALRRVMLSALRGAAVTKVKIKGVNHQFTTLHGMQEDIVEFILNVKQLRIAYSGDAPETLNLSASGPGPVTAKDIDLPPTVRIVNPELVLATLADKKTKLAVELTVESGSGYLTAEEQGKQKLGVIPVDASFSPVREVSYSVEATRVGRRTDYDKLVMTVRTDGSIKPSDAVMQAAAVLIEHFQQIVSPSSASSDDSGKGAPTSQSTLLALAVEELELPTRVANALRHGGYHTVGDIVRAGSGALSEVKNIGQKSIADIIEKIRQRGIDIHP